MAKKSRRVRRKDAQPRLSEAQLVQPTRQAVQEAIPVADMEEVKTTQRPLAIGNHPRMETDFRQEYHYVVSDLQRIGLLAAVMLGGLLILSFIL